MTRTAINTYKTYVFKDKDPIIDDFRTALADAAEKAGVGAAEMEKRAAADSGVNRSTLAGWLRGPVRRPQNATMKAAVRALGPEYDYCITVNGRAIYGRRIGRRRS